MPRKLAADNTTMQQTQQLPGQLNWWIWMQSNSTWQ